MIFNCEHCGAKLKVENNENYGTIVDCPECSNKITIPEFESSNQQKDNAKPKSRSKKIFNFLFIPKRCLIYLDNKTEEAEKARAEKTKKINAILEKQKANAKYIEDVEAIRSGGNITIPAIKAYTKTNKYANIDICQYCKKEIPSNTLKCSHCGSDLEISGFTATLIIIAVIFFLCGLGWHIGGASVRYPWGYKENAITKIMEATINVTGAIRFLTSAVCYATSFILLGLISIRQK